MMARVKKKRRPLRCKRERATCTRGLEDLNALRAALQEVSDTLDQRLLERELPLSSSAQRAFRRDVRAWFLWWLTPEEAPEHGARERAKENAGPRIMKALGLADMERDYYGEQLGG